MIKKQTQTYLAFLTGGLLLGSVITVLIAGIPEPQPIHITKTEVVTKEVRIRTFVPTDPERECMAQAIFAEARSESFEGQQAVARVIQNRVSDKRYPNTICGVVHYINKGVYHFSYNYRKDPSFYVTARVFANMVGISADERRAKAEAYLVADSDFTSILPASALNYHANYIKPDWDWSKLEKIKTIGGHTFYTGY